MMEPKRSTFVALAYRRHSTVVRLAEETKGGHSRVCESIGTIVFTSLFPSEASTIRSSTKERGQGCWFSDSCSYPLALGRYH